MLKRERHFSLLSPLKFNSITHLLTNSSILIEKADQFQTNLDEKLLVFFRYVCHLRACFLLLPSQGLIIHTNLRNNVIYSVKNAKDYAISWVIGWGTRFSASIQATTLG
jgi:hypothetical protein